MKKDKIYYIKDKVFVLKQQKPTCAEFLKLFDSVDWERNIKRVKQNLKATVFASCVYCNNQIVGMGRIVGDGAYFTIYDVVVDKNFQGNQIGSIIMQSLVDWYKTIKDDDTFLYTNASKGKEAFYEKFGFKVRPNEDVGAGMKWYE